MTYENDAALKANSASPDVRSLMRIRSRRAAQSGPGRVSIWNLAHRLRDPQSFRGWLVRITFRVALDRARSSKRREQRETLWARPLPAPTTEDLAASSEFQAHFDRALDTLPDKLRLVLLLCAMEGHTLEEVAAMLGVPVGTVKSRLFVARKKLAEKLRCHVNVTKKR